MLIEHGGRRPTIHPTSRIAPNAVVCGDVTVGPNCSIGFGAVLTAESGSIVLGRDVVVMDTAVIRGVRGLATTIGDAVLVGPRAYLSGCAIGDAVFLATGATVFNGARVGARAEVRINGLVHLRTVLAEGATVPIGWIAVGDPAEILPPDAHDAIWAIQKTLDFPKFVFGVDRPADGETMMPDAMRRYASFLGRAHGEDVILDEAGTRAAGG